MIHASSLVTDDWDAIVARLGGAEALETGARLTGAFLRPRKIRSAVDLLRFTLLMPRFISSSTQEPRARLHGGFPMVAGAARKPRAKLFSPPLRGSSRPLRCKKARPFGSLVRLGPGRVQASPVPPITERHRNGAQPQRWREP